MQSCYDGLELVVRLDLLLSRSLPHNKAKAQRQPTPAEQPTCAEFWMGGKEEVNERELQRERGRRESHLFPSLYFNLSFLIESFPSLQNNSLQLIPNLAFYLPPLNHPIQLAAAPTNPPPATVAAEDGEGDAEDDPSPPLPPPFFFVGFLIPQRTSNTSLTVESK
jgi:hypothetical protein